jgi:hypothetical protein
MTADTQPEVTAYRTTRSERRSSTELEEPGGAHIDGYLLPASSQAQLLRVIRSQRSTVPPATHVGHPSLALAPGFGDALAMQEHQEHV